MFTYDKYLLFNDKKDDQFNYKIVEYNEYQLII